MESILVALSVHPAMTGWTPSGSTALDSDPDAQGCVGLSRA